MTDLGALLIGLLFLAKRVLGILLALPLAVLDALHDFGCKQVGVSRVSLFYRIGHWLYPEPWEHEG